MKSTPTKATDLISPDLLPNLRHDVRLLSMIESDEGFSDKLYKDTKGLNTIGIGFCLDRRLMPKAVALFWLDMIIDEIVDDLGHCVQYDTYIGLNAPRRFAIINMCYQMGTFNVCHPVTGFKNMWASLKLGQYEDAANHALDSKWYKEDTPNRAMKVAEVIRTGRMVNY